MHNEAEAVLNSYQEISNIKNIEEEALLFNIDEHLFLFVCPQVDSSEDRPFIYLCDKQHFDYPHVLNDKNNVYGVDNCRSICLYDENDIVFSTLSFEEKIRDAINRLIFLFELNSTRLEEEYQKEFIYYWNKYSNKNIKFEIFIRNEGFIRVEKYNSSEKPTSKEKQTSRLIQEGIELSDLKSKTKKNKDKWIKNIDDECFYIPIEDMRDIIPPTNKHIWDIRDIKEIICGKFVNHISNKYYDDIKTKYIKSKNIILVFGFKYKKKNVTFAVKLYCDNKTNRTLYEKIMYDVEKIELFDAERRDYLYLSKSIGNNIINEEKIILVGCGSLGSYIAPELIKNGYCNVDIYDGDILMPENSFRWMYPICCKGNKANYIKLFLEGYNPEIKINAYRNLEEGELAEEIDKTNLIIFAIGSTDEQLKFNKVLKENNYNGFAIYCWVEAGGQFSHILVIDYKKQGCYQCLCSDKEGNLINNQANSNANKNTDEFIIEGGCNGTRVAYGTAVLLRTTAALLDTLKKINNNELDKNIVIDINNQGIEESNVILPGRKCMLCGTC